MSLSLSYLCASPSVQQEGEGKPNLSFGPLVKGWRKGAWSGSETMRSDMKGVMDSLQCGGDESHALIVEMCRRRR